MKAKCWGMGILLGVVVASGCAGEKDTFGREPDGNAGKDAGGAGGSGGSGGSPHFNDAGQCLTPCGSGALCCADGEECVNDFACAPVCENVRCGDNDLTCCESDQVCLDEVICAAACEEDRVVCGAELDVCCGDDEVCVEDECVEPGDTCGDDFDCLTEGTYCEHTIERCLGNPAPPLCEVRPEFSDIELEVEWHWEGVTIEGTLFSNVVASPAVGDISGDGVPEVVVPVYAGSSSLNTILVALDGRTGVLLWSVGSNDVDEPNWLSMVALGNLDTSDSALEIVYRSENDGLIVLDGDGTTVLARLTTGSGGTTNAISPSLADMDHDGIVEVISGCQVLSFEPMGAGFVLTSRGDGGACTESSHSFASTAVANFDDDADLELTSGAAMFELDGTQVWPAAGTPLHGLVAVADLDVDGEPEVISVRAGNVTIRDGATGTMRVGAGGTWFDGAITIPGGGIGGAPTVADFDGDGLPEVSTAGLGCYVVYDPDCLPTPPRDGGDCTHPADDPMTTCDDDPGVFVRWARPTQDISSSDTGSSVFDFQGDGVSEVIYNDECFLHIYDGRDGRGVLAELRPNSSRTALEYPLVVDVDRDGNSEIVVPANNDQAVSRDHCDDLYAEAFGVEVAELPDDIRTGTTGIFVFGDPQDRWVRTRPIWNQFNYHVTHVDDLGSVPMDEDDNWSVPGLNNYRQNVQGGGVFNAPNLTATLDAIASCGASTLRLSAVVTNHGNRGVPAGVQVKFLQIDPSSETLDTVVTTRPLLPGASERLTITVSPIEYGTNYTFEVRVDGGDAEMPVVECMEDDNRARATELCQKPE